MRNHLWVLALLWGCLSPEPEGLATAQPAATTVKMDFLHKPLPEIPLPNDIATRHDATSATGRRINASLLAPTRLEQRVRELIDQIDGFSLMMPITIPFTAPLDVQSVLDAHSDPHYGTDDDVLYLIDVDRDSPDFGKVHHLDLGNGSYPVIAEQRDNFWRNGPRTGNLTLIFEEDEEDTNGNGVLDPGEDTDADGVLDHPNFLPGHDPAPDDAPAIAKAIMTFYEKETNTLIAKPVKPLRERTTYAVVVTRRLKDANGAPVGSPYPTVNHPAQTEALRPLEDVMPEGLSMDDVAFAFSFTTQTTTSDWHDVRDGLYGHGIQKHLAKEFPARLATVEPLKDLARFSGSNPHIIYGEEWLAGLRLVMQIRDEESTSVAGQQLLDFNSYVDYQVIGSFDSPQLFPREDENGDWLPFNDQSWPPDLHAKPAPTRPERVYFYLSVPRKEVSARGEGKPAPLVLLGHGHTGNRFSVTTLAGLMARHGLALLAIDNVSHGLEVKGEDRELAETILGGLGFRGFVDAAFKDRAHDQNNDGDHDSGADFWTAYVFHTRDVVRQSLLDYMHLVRIISSFDGERRWDFDLNGDGTNELAGDFDADGVVDIGVGGEITMTGGSLGGIMSMLVGALEPKVKAIAPVVGGGFLSEITRRTLNGSVRKAVHLRLLGPLYTGTRQEDGTMQLHQIIPDINDDAPELHFATIEGVEPGDTMLLENLVNGERQCGMVDPEGRVRAPIESDAGDPVRVSFYRGPVFRGGDGCEITTDAEPVITVDRLQHEITFQSRSYAPGTPLRSLADGLGMRRGTPDVRRFMGLAQIVLDRADPAAYARHLLDEPIKYPGTGDAGGAHALILTGTGDLNVPVSTGANVGRAAGIIGYLEDHPGYDVPANQALIDNGITMGVEDVGDKLSSTGERWLADADDFSGDGDFWAGLAPRVDPPIRAGLGVKDAIGGASAAFFPYGSPFGKHGFDDPGEMIDNAIRRCRDTCAEGMDCACEDTEVWDVGNFFFNMMGEFLASGGTRIRTDACMSSQDCSDFMPLPADREPSELR